MSPTLAWVRQWGISVASFAGGLLTLLVFRRELPHVGWIVGYLLLLWLLVGVMVQARDVLEVSERRSHRLAVTAAEYTIQTLYHGVLLFLLPPYWASTTLTSKNAFFFGLLVVLALLATFDPWYSALVHSRPWVGWIFFLVSTFCALGVALPLVGVPPHLALVLSAWVAMVALTPAVVRALRWPWRRCLVVTAVLGVGAALLAHLGREWIPPAPLSLARATLAWRVEDLDTLEPASVPVSASELKERGLIAYTAVYAPAGLRENIRHVWRHEGQVVSVVELPAIRGGRRQGFRTYSRKRYFPENPGGLWTVDVETAWGQLIGRLHFSVTS